MWVWWDSFKFPNHPKVFPALPLVIFRNVDLQSVVREALKEVQNTHPDLDRQHISAFPLNQLSSFGKIYNNTKRYVISQVHGEVEARCRSVADNVLGKRVHSAKYVVGVVFWAVSCYTMLFNIVLFQSIPYRLGGEVLIFFILLTYDGKLGILPNVVVPELTKFPCHSLKQRPVNTKVAGHVVALP